MVKLLRCECDSCGFSAEVPPVGFEPREGEKCASCDRGQLKWQVVHRKIDLETPLEAILVSYPRLCAHLICESLGYLTPLGAANLIKHVALGQKFWCEWISHLEGDCKVKDATRQVVKWAVSGRRRHRGFMADYDLARLAIARELAGYHVQFASWF